MQENLLSIVYFRKTKTIFTLNSPTSPYKVKISTGVARRFQNASAFFHYTTWQKNSFKKFPTFAIKLLLIDPPLFRVLTTPILIDKTSVHFVSPVSISLIHLGNVGTSFPVRSIFTISSVSSFLQNLSRI